MQAAMKIKTEEKMDEANITMIEAKLLDAKLLEADEEGSNFTLDDFPPELLKKVSSYLEIRDLLSMSRVSQRLRTAVTRDHTLWSSVQLCTTKSSNSYAKLISKYSSKLKNLSLLYQTKFSLQNTAEALQHFTDCGHLVEKIEIRPSKKDDIVEEVASSFPNVSEAKMSEVDFMTVHGINISSKLDLLQEMDNSDPVCDEKVFELIAQNFPKLRDLKVEALFSECNKGVIEIIESHKDTLKKLHLDAYKLAHSNYEKLADCQNLQELVLPHAFALSDDGLASLQKLPNLKKLVIGYTHSVPASAWWDFFENAPLSELEHLDITGSKMSDQSAFAIARNCRNLRHLVFKECSNLTEVGVKALLTKCRRLISLTLDAIPISEECLIKIPQNLTELRYLTLGDVLYSRERSSARFNLLPSS